MYIGLAHSLFIMAAEDLKEKEPKGEKMDVDTPEKIPEKEKSPEEIAALVLSGNYLNGGFCSQNQD